MAGGFAKGRFERTAFAVNDGLDPTVFTINSVNRTSFVSKFESEIHDYANETPNTASLMVRGFTPTVGMRVTITRVGVTLFDGEVTDLQQVQRRTGTRLRYRLDCQDWAHLLDRRLVIKEYPSTAISTIVSDVISNFTTGFTTNVETIATSIPFTAVLERVSQILTRLANAAGATWKLLYDKTVYFRVTSTLTAPTSLTTANAWFRRLVYRRKIDQIKTRAYVIGAGSGVTAGGRNAQIPVGATQIPIGDTSMFPSGAGSAIVRGQILTYTGKSADAGNGTTVAGVPQSPGSLSAAVAGVGGNLTNGTYLYKQTCVNANGDESEPGSSASVTINTVTAPGAPSVAASSGVSGNLAAGTFGYKVAYKTATGITLPGSSGSAAISAVTAPSAPSAAQTSGVTGNLDTSGARNWKIGYTTANGTTLPGSASSGVTISTVGAPGALSGSATTGGSLTTGRDYYYRVSYVTSKGETTAGSGFGIAISGANNASSLTSIPTSSDGRVIARRIYRADVAGGGSPPADSLYHLLTTINDNATTTYTDGTADATAYAGAGIPPSNTTGYGQVSLTSIPTSGDGRVTARVIYRTKGGGSTYYKVGEINDNSGTTFTDNVDDSALVELAPAASTADFGKMSLTSIPTSGDARVTARVIYRTVVGGSDYYVLATIPDNATTTYTDNVGDSTLINNDPAPAALTDKTSPNNDKVSLTSISTGPAGTVARKVYRTLVGGSVYRYAFTLSDNVTTTATDNSADTSLGLEIPTESKWRTVAGSTTLPVQDLSKYSEGNGWVKVGAQVIKFTGRAASSGRGNLTGVPASGVGSIAADVSFDTEVIGQPFLKGIPSSSTGSILAALNEGDAVNLFVQRDDTTAQTALAALEGGDGIHETRVNDNSLTSVAACNARGDAELALQKNVEEEATYTTEDTVTQAGARVTINISGISTTLTIHQMRIYWIAGRRLPQRDVTCASQYKNLYQYLADLERQTGRAA